MGVSILNDASGIYNSRDKFRSIQLLTANKIPIPVTYFSNDLHHAEKIVKYKLGYPFIIKTLEGTQGQGVYLIKNELEAHQLFDKFTRVGVNVLLQEFISEFKGKDIRAFVVGDKVVASMMRVAEGDEFRSNIHRGGNGLYRFTFGRGEGNGAKSCESF